MLEALHAEYQRHMSTVAPLFEKQDMLLPDGKKILRRGATVSISQYIDLPTLKVNINKLLTKTPASLGLDEIHSHMWPMAMALHTLFKQKQHNNVLYQEAICFLVIFFLRILYEFLNAPKDSTTLKNHVAETKDLSENLAENLEHKEGCQILRKYQNLVQQKRELLVLIFRTLSANPFERKSLAFHIQRKNAKNAAKTEQKNENLNIQMIYDEDSLMYFRCDTELLSLNLWPLLEEILQGRRPRTQFIIYPNGQGPHALLLDVQKSNPTGGQSKSTLQCICIESAKNIAQFGFLEALKLFFKEKKSFFDGNNSEVDIIGCQADLQKDLNNCAVYCFAFASIVSKIPFSHFKKPEYQIPPPRSNDSDQVKLVRLFMKDQGIPFFLLQALGEKAMLMAQSLEQINKLLTEDYLIKNPLPPHNNSAAAESARQLVAKNSTQQTLDKWKKSHSLEFGAQNSKRLTYIELREKRLGEKEKLGPLLSLNAAMEGVRAEKKNPSDPPEELTLGQALRRYAAGKGPNEGWLTILDTAISAGVLNEGKTITKSGEKPFTALDFAVERGQASRALDLHKRGAKSWVELNK